MKIIVLDKYYDFKRREGYFPMGFLTAKDEILEVCRKNRILVSSIVKYDGYQVTGKKIRNKKTFDKAYKALKT